MGCEMVLDMLEGTAMPQVWGDEAEQRRHMPESLVGTMASWQRKLSCISAGLMLEPEDKHVNVSSLIDMWNRSCQFFSVQGRIQERLNGMISTNHMMLMCLNRKKKSWMKKNMLWIGQACFNMKEIMKCKNKNEQCFWLLKGIIA